MQFQPGKSGNPGGRRKGSVGGRSLAVADEMLAKADIGRFENRAAGQRSYRIRRMMLIFVVV
jgi:hypothetical protein